MDKEQVIKILAEFFRDSIAEDYSGVGDWFAQGGESIEDFLRALDEICPEVVLRDGE